MLTQLADCVKEKDALRQKVENTGLAQKTSGSQNDQELEQLKQELVRARKQSGEKVATLNKELESKQSEMEVRVALSCTRYHVHSSMRCTQSHVFYLRFSGLTGHKSIFLFEMQDLQRQLNSRTEEVRTLQERENSLTKEIKTIQVESEAQKSALESQIASLKQQLEQNQTKITAQEDQNRTTTAAKEALDSCKARVVELDAKVKALESDKLDSQTKVSELTDVAASLRQQLQEAQAASASLTQQIQNQVQDVEKLEAQVTDRENSLTKEIETMRVESEAQKSALESQIASLKQQQEQHQTQTAKARGLDAKVKALESDKLDSQTKVSELTDAAASLRQQLQEAKAASSSLTKQVEQQANSITKLESDLTKINAANGKLSSQCEALSKQQQDSAAQSKQTQAKLKEAQELHAAEVEELMSYKTKMKAYEALEKQLNKLSQKHKDVVAAMQAKEDELKKQKDLRAKAIQELKDMEKKLNGMQTDESRESKHSQQNKHEVTNKERLQNKPEEAKETHANKPTPGMMSKNKMLFIVIPIVMALAGMYYLRFESV